jgi:hypothetical protein
LKAGILPKIFYVQHLTGTALCYTIQTPVFSCAGDYQSDNHPKIPPYIGKSVEISEFYTYIWAKNIAHCASNS